MTIYLKTERRKWEKLLCSQIFGKKIDITRTVSVFLQPLELTPETAPAGHVAGSIVRQDFTVCGKTGRHDRVSELDRSRQLDQGNVVTGTQMQTPHL